MQMKMFLTRLGFNSKMIVNGDTSQIDLPRNVKSGLIDAQESEEHFSKSTFAFLCQDVVRHPVVARLSGFSHSESSPQRKPDVEEE